MNLYTHYIVMNHNSSRRRGFTITELLTTIGIIGVLLAMSFPAFQVVREAARRSNCSANIRQLGMALHAHEGTGRGFPAASNREGGSFIIRLLSFLDQKQLQDEAKSARLGRKTQDEQLQHLSGTKISVLLCPSHFGEDIHPTLPFQGKFATHYYGVAGPVHAAMTPNGNEFQYGALFPKPEHGEISLAGVFAVNSKGKFVSRELQDISDGTSNTIALGEISGSRLDFKSENMIHRSGWPFGAKFDENGWPSKSFAAKSLVVGINKSGQPINTQSFNSNHTRGAMFAFADASVHYIDDRVSVDVLKMFASISDSEELRPLDEY